MIISIIKKYQQSVDRAVSIFKNKFGVTDVIKGWHDGLYPGNGHISEEGLTAYQFHGLGLRANFESSEQVDFDFLYTLKNVDGPWPISIRQFDPAQFYLPRHDGINLHMLCSYVARQTYLYPNYQDKNVITKDFDDLILNGTIARQTNSRHLYFFTKTIPADMLVENTKSTINHSFI